MLGRRARRRNGRRRLAGGDESGRFPAVRRRVGAFVARVASKDYVAAGIRRQRTAVARRRNLRRSRRRRRNAGAHAFARNVAAEPRCESAERLHVGRARQRRRGGPRAYARPRHRFHGVRTLGKREASRRRRPCGRSADARRQGRTDAGRRRKVQTTAAIACATRSTRKCANRRVSPLPKRPTRIRRSARQSARSRNCATSAAAGSS